MLNRVDIIGHLGRDPETRYTAGGDAVCTLSVATTERWTDRATGERQESTEWHRVALFGKLAETAQRYLQRGGLVYVSGRIRTRYELPGLAPVHRRRGGCPVQHQRARRRASHAGRPPPRRCTSPGARA